MANVRVFATIGLAAILAACSSPASRDRTTNAELSDLAALKQRYPDVVAGFDLRGNTAIVSLDLQHYIEMDDDAAIALKRDALAGWRSAWMAQHPHQHATLRLRFIDFIGRKVAEETTKV